MSDTQRILELEAECERLRAVIARGAQPSEPKTVLTSVEAADMIGVSRPTLMKHARAGALPSFQVRSHTRFRVADVNAYIAYRQEQRARAFKELRTLDEVLGEQS